MKETTLSTMPDARSSQETELQLIGYLEDLLNRQLEKLRKYDLDGAFQLAEESGEIAGRVRELGLLERPQYGEEKERIQGLYQEICLVIASERQEVSDKLKQIREGIRTLSKYAAK